MSTSSPSTAGKPSDGIGSPHRGESDIGVDDERSIPIFFRKRSTLHLPITLSVALMSLNVLLMVLWILLLAQRSYWGTLSIGVVAFALMLVGLSVYLALTIKEVRLNRRQANFVDSVTHELKSPIASLQLYLDTLQMRQVPYDQQRQFFDVMRDELDRLNRLISQLLQTARLDEIGQDTVPEAVPLTPLIRSCAETACRRRGVDPERVVQFEGTPTVVIARRMVLEIIFTNLIDNAIKYGGDPPEVIIRTQPRYRGRIGVRVIDNGLGIPSDDRSKIFRIFYRGGHELQRKKTGTGLGLYIVRTLVASLKGRISVSPRTDRTGSVFEVELYQGKTEARDG